MRENGLMPIHAASVLAGATAASVVLASPRSASVAVRQIVTMAGAASSNFPTSKTLTHPVQGVVVSNNHASNIVYVRVDGEYPTGASPGDVTIPPYTSIKVPAGSRSGSVSVGYIATGATTPVTMRLT